MQTQIDPLKDLNAIRQLMERSNKFISLSGLSGVIAGVAALAGAALAQYKMHGNPHRGEVQSIWTPYLLENLSDYSFFVLDALIVLIVAIGAGIIPTMARARKTKQAIFNPVAYRLAINLFIPVLTGGILCLLLINYSIFGLIAPSMLVFYGLGLVNASNFTLPDIRYLGYIQILLGLINGIFNGHGLVFLAIGFGVMHIIYGLFMYFKYERS